MQKRQIYIADTIHNTILLSIYEKEVISTQLFNRLHNISQNSTAYLTFPTNRTKRFEHSLGTMKLCGDIVYYSFTNSSPEVINDFLMEIKKCIVQEIVQGLVLKESDKFRPILLDTNIDERKLTDFENVKFHSVFYNNSIPANISTDERLLYLVLFQAIRICGLLHDIGHPPFSHITESAINNVYKVVSSRLSKTKREEEFLNILNQYELDKHSSQLHERMGNRMTDRMVSDLLYGNDEWYKNKSFEEKYFKILVFETVKSIFEEKTPVFNMVHKVIDGVIDGDRLDYVNRDIINSGINNGRLEYDRLISSMQIFKKDNQYLFVSDTKTVNTVEDFFFKRWNLYKNIIYHHRVIKTDSLLQNCIERIILDHLSNPDLEHDSSGEYILPYNISGLWKAIKIANSNTKYFNSLIQWDDGWLFAILKRHYFEDFYDSTDFTKYQLEELLSNKKNYYSIIKNSTDFELLNEGFQKIIIDHAIYNTEEFKKIEEILSKKSNNVSMLYILEAYFEAYYKGVFDFKDFIRENIISFIGNTYSDCIEHQIIVYKSISSGLKTEPNVYKNGDVISLSKFSNIKNILEGEKYTISYFYIYLKFINKDMYIKKPDFNNGFLNKLGLFLANKTVEYLKSQN